MEGNVRAHWSVKRRRLLRASRGVQSHASRSRILRVRGFCAGTKFRAYGKGAVWLVFSRRAETFFPQTWAFFPADLDLFPRRPECLPPAAPEDLRGRPDGVGRGAAVAADGEAATWWRSSHRRCQRASGPASDLRPIMILATRTDRRPSLQAETPVPPQAQCQ